MVRMSWREANRCRWVGVRPAHEGAAFFGSGVKSNGTAILYTVPAGQTAFLTYLSLQWSHTAQTTVVQLFVRDTEDALAFRLVYSNQTNTTSLAVATGLPYPIEVAAGYDICILGNAGAGQVSGCVSGWVE